MPINQANFEKVRDIFVAQKGVFVVPVFQRPYAWEKEQVDALMEDIEVGASMERPIHYLSPIHVIQVQNNSHDRTWINYVDQANQDVMFLNQSSFLDDSGDRLDVRLVIDGQQRLTTLFMLFWAISRDGLIVHVNGRKVPKLILNPMDDHYRFRELLSLPTLPPTFRSRSQKLLKQCYDDTQSPTHVDFIRNRLQTLLIQLDTNYGLQAFQTQNDRGKPLTNLERLKSLLMDFDLNRCNGIYVHDVHRIFGELYRVLDQSMECDIFSAKDGEDQMIQLLSIFLRATHEANIDWHGSSKIYNEYFKENLKAPGDGENVGSQIQFWNKGIEVLSRQLDLLNQCLLSPPSLVSTIVSSRTVGDDYQIILKSLVLSRRTLAALLKFRQQFPRVEWHERIAEIHCENDPVIEFLRTRLRGLRDSLGGEQPPPIARQIEALEERLEQLPNISTRSVSALEVMERLELFIWKMGFNPDANFRARWIAAFDSYVAPERCLQLWYEWISSNYRTLFMTRLDTEWAREEIYRYVLREYEAAEYGQNIHFNRKLALEHIFAVNFDSTVSYGVDAASIQYEHFISSIANRTFLDLVLNGAIGNWAPLDKAEPYRTQSSGRQYTVPSANQVRSTMEIGRIFREIQENRLYKIALQLRSLELTRFAAERFF